MTTPAVAINNSTIGIQTEQYGTNETGLIPPQVVNYRAGSRFCQFRPASVKNPIRSDGTRGPANWTSRGGYFHSSEGSLVLSFNGTSTYLAVNGKLVEAPGNLGSILPVIDTADGTAYAIRKALGHYGEAEQQLGVAMAEARDTARLTTDFYRGSADFFSKLDLEVRRSGTAKRSLQNFAKGWRDAPSWYLAYLYGMRPLSDDVVNSLVVLTDMSDERKFKLTLKGKFKINDVRDVQLNCSTFCTVKVPIRTYQEHRASLVFSLPDWFWEELPAVSPFSQAYETQRLSFVLDWILPVKNWLRGFEGLQLRPFFQEGSLTMFLRQTGNVAHPSPVSGVSASRSAIPVTWKAYQMIRDAIDTMPTESVMRLPRFRSTLGLDKLDQAAALAGQAFAKLSKSLR